VLHVSVFVVDFLKVRKTALIFVHRVAAVVVCTPTFEHEVIVRTALQSGAFTILCIVFYSAVLLLLPGSSFHNV